MRYMQNCWRLFFKFVKENTKTIMLGGWVCFENNSLLPLFVAWQIKFGCHPLINLSFQHGIFPDALAAA